MRFGHILLLMALEQPPIRDRLDRSFPFKCVGVICTVKTENSTMEQLSISQFTQPAQPFAPFKGPLRTLQPMKSVPKVKRPVGRPRKRPREDPDTQTQPNDGGEASRSQGSSEKKVRAAYTMEKKQKVVNYAKAYSIYQASKQFSISPGTIGPWMKIDFSKEKTVGYSELPEVVES